MATVQRYYGGVFSFLKGSVMIDAQAVSAKGGDLAPFSYEPTEMGPFDCEIRITHCGICHSDVHLIDDDWGMSQYPMVPGHEIIGEVTALGPQADPAILGQRVGVGWQRGACLRCDWCLRGEENLCRASVATCVGHYGGFATAVRLDSRFVHPIPPALASQDAAPLLCAGITVYAPLRRHNVTANQRVGVVGIGGLGHLAVQYAARMGCEVVAFTSTPAKAEEARQLGATQVVDSRDSNAMKALRYSLDFIISTVAVNLDWTAYLRTLGANGVLCFVGAPSEALNIRVGHLMDVQRSVTASSIGGRALIREMLDFSARHNIRAWTETLPLDAVNTAVARLRQNDVRYRFVLAV